MRAVLDACVLYPTVLREILTGVAEAELFTPLWSARILEEWARAVARNLPDQAETARAEITLLRLRFPGAELSVTEADHQGLWLPDEDDIHVLAAARAGQADVIVTANLNDFPLRILEAEGMARIDPDRFLLNLWQAHPAAVAGVVEQVRQTAERLSGEDQPLRQLLKRARLPRLGKALGGG